MAQENKDTIEQSITPWEVQGEVVDGQQVGIDYEKIMTRFGCQPIDQCLISRLERLSGEPAHPLVKRGVFYCHRDLERILDLHEQRKPFYLYTGRGPSSESMHLGHMVPFIFCQYLQRIFKCYIVIQMTDDEKFLFKEQLSLDECQKYAFENAKDIIAVGFNPEKTFIFPNTKYFPVMFETVLKIQKLVSYKQVQSIFGFDGSNSIGQISFPATQIAPSFSAVFPHIFHGSTDIPCLIPCAIDQDPYFRLCRDLAGKLKYQKPATICASFFPALQGFHTKMSASSENTAIFMNDSAEKVALKINKYAFSGGRTTIEEQRQYGADLEVDIPYQYLRFFMDDDKEFERIGEEYKNGRMATGQIKAICISVLQNFLLDFQKRRAQVTDDLVKHYMKF